MTPDPARTDREEAPPAVGRRILVVDDEVQVAQMLEQVLTRFGHDVEVARDGVEAMARLRLGFDLLLLDADMPGLDGFEVARRVRTDPDLHDLPILMITGRGGTSDRLRAVEAGVNDFIAKPFELTELRIRSNSLLRMKDGADALKRHRRELEETVVRRTAALRQALDEMAEAQRRTHHAHLDTIRRLVLAAESRDRSTGAHIERIAAYCGLLGEGLGLSPHDVELLRIATPMHDVGKIGIPDGILLKPEPLTAEEWELMRQHTTLGARLLHGSPSELLQAGEEIALSHHERYDGSGYPNQLAGDRIPLFGRICAVADVFDALTSARPYRRALPPETVFRMMAEERGRHFDPQLLDIFLAMKPQVEEVFRAGQDTD